VVHLRALVRLTRPCVCVCVCRRVRQRARGWRAVGVVCASVSTHLAIRHVVVIASAAILCVQVGSSLSLCVCV
jgi:hypothetical protein